MIQSLTITNFRCLESLEQFAIPRTGVFFGPNGAGKTSLFDAIWLVRDCCKIGPKEALNERGQGFGLLRQNATEKLLKISLDDDSALYRISFQSTPVGLSSLPSEQVFRHEDRNWIPIIEKDFGANHYVLNHDSGKSTKEPLRSEDRLAFENFVTGRPHKMVSPLWSELNSAAYLHSRSLDLTQIKNQGSSASSDVRLAKNGSNLWPVLRNLNDWRDSDTDGLDDASRLDRILHWTKKAFPFFNGWKFVSGGSSQVYAEAKINNVRDTIPVSQLADGVIQMTLLLVALFSEGTNPRLIMFDEPDLSLHPWALFVLAEAIEEAATKWNRQVLLATHSPVLLSQFPEESLFLMMPKDGATTIQRVSEMTENRDLLNQYAVGSLYMSQLIGEQSPEPMVHVVEMKQ